MEHYYLCPKCRSKTLLPTCSVCGFKIPLIDSIYRFCNDASVKLEGDKQYIGYDDIGEDFEPEITYCDANNTERYGVYAACSDLIAKKFGTNISVLDLGAGLGSASIPLAKNGIYTIAADISAIMLKTAAKRSKGIYPNLILTQMNAYDIMLPNESVDIVVENASGIESAEEFKEKFLSNITPEYLNQYSIQMIDEFRKASSEPDANV